MTLSKKILRLLFGTTHKFFLKNKNQRVITINFPCVEKGDKYREIEFRGDDGLILYFLKRMEDMEEQIKDNKCTYRHSSVFGTSDSPTAYLGSKLGTKVRY